MEKVSTRKRDNARCSQLTPTADVAIPHGIIMHKNIRLYGKWMYEREDIVDIFKMVETGLLDLNFMKIVGEYPLEKYKEAWDHAAEMAGFGETVLIKP